MSKTIKYFPTLKWKEGERIALKELTDDQKLAITPIIEIVDSDLSVPSFLDRFSELPIPFIVDTIREDDDRLMLIEILRQGKHKDIPIIPLLYISDIEMPQSEIINESDEIAVVVPIPEELEGPSHENIFKLLANLESSHAISLVLDLGLILEQKEANTAYALLKLFLDTHATKLLKFQNIIIRTSSFPTDLSAIQSGSKVSFPRYDMRILKKIVTENKDSLYVRKLAYSDYGVTKFTDTELDFSKLKYGVLPKVKYSGDDCYHVLKGKRNHETGEWMVSYKDLAKAIVELDDYYGQEFSYGDQEIFRISSAPNKHGSNRSWVTYCANHHIAVVVDELSKVL